MGTVHSAHEDMPFGAVLADDCDRCAEHARTPFAALDDSNLRRLADFVDYHSYAKPATTNDRIAVGFIKEVFDKYNRIMRVRGTVTS